MVWRRVGVVVRLVSSLVFSRGHDGCRYSRASFRMKSVGGFFFWPIIGQLQQVRCSKRPLPDPRFSLLVLSGLVVIVAAAPRREGLSRCR